MNRPIWKKRLFSLIFGILLATPAVSRGAVDTYVGDTEIYGATSGTSSSTAPNVLFLIDDSGSMNDAPPASPSPYDPTVTYAPQNICVGSLEHDPNSAYASLEKGIRTELARPPFYASANPSVYGEDRSKKSSGFGDGVKAAVSAVSAGWNGGIQAVKNLIWDGKMPEFVRVLSHTISGTVSGMGSSTVSLSLSGTDGNGNPVALNTTTNAAGDYTFTVPTKGNYTITPSLTGYTFTSALPMPVCAGGGFYCNGSPGIPQSDPANVDFTATPAGANYDILGYIASGGPLAGVTVTVTDGSGNVVSTVVTDNFGKYDASGLSNGTYTVTPGPYTGYTFNPTSQSVTISGGNQRNVNFTATHTGTSYQISGTIQDATGKNMKNVTITVTTSLGANFATTTTNKYGNYTIVGLAGGSSYTVTPTFAGYTFAYYQSPNGPNTSVSGPNNQVNFTGTAGGAAGTYAIAGTVYDASGNKLNGVTLTVKDGSNNTVGTATSGVNGSYSISGVAPGTYTLIPTMTGYTFSPVNQSVTVTASNISGINFTGTLTGSAGGCGEYTIYKFTAGSPDTYNNWGNLSDGVQSNCANAYTALTTTGVWIGNLNATNGTCNASDQAGAFFLGNYLNFTININPTPSGTPKITIAINTVQQLVQSNSGLNMGLMTYSLDSHGGTFIKLSNGYTSYVQPSLSGSYGGTTNQANLITAVGTLYASTWTPLGGALYDAMLYYMGKAPFTTSSSTFNSPSVAYSAPATYPSPINSGCQPNYVIIVTDGMSTKDTAVGSPFATLSGCANGDCDGDASSNSNETKILGLAIPDSGTDYLDDIAYYMHNNDMIASKPGSKVTVYTIGFSLDPADYNDLQGITLLTNTANNGGGKFVNVTGAASLMTTLTQILGSILQVNTSFVAPVVPVSPANRTYSGNSVYVGLFLPQSTGFWYGNVKKFGFVNGQVVDNTGNPATSTTGAFNATASSVWDPQKVTDAGLVAEGGTGAVLYYQTPQKRNLFTYLGSSSFLTSSSNAFTSGNTALTPALFGLSSASSVTSTINYVWGFDPGGASERTWIMGDVLHSEPAVVNYANNLSMVYVGGNDGILHAFADINPMNYNCSVTTFGQGGSPVSVTNGVYPPVGCPGSFTAPTMTQPLGSSTIVNIMDGQEVWGFVPPNILPNLSNLNSAVHGYGVDGSPAMYYYDANGDGKIGHTSNDCQPAGSSNCDQVLLVFGERRGGQAYWTLDVTDPLNPQVKWHIDNTVAGYSELGETFSQPQIAPVNTGGSTPEQLVFLAAGYDNVDEDQNISPSYSTTTGFNMTDTSGRGIYAVDLQSGNYVWSWVYSSTRATVSNGASNNPVYSFPSDVTVLDSNNNGTVDTIYVGDVGGQMWKFDISSSTISSWNAKVVFKSNPGNDGSKGRKIFYPPDVTYETGYQAVFFGTGDREHPFKNSGGAPAPSPIPVDRLYASYDNPNYTHFVTEGGTTSVSSTTNPQLQDVTSTNAPVINGAGWYIRMNDFNDPAWSASTGTGYSTVIGKGEKMLAPPIVLDKVVTFTTYAPNMITQSGSCGAALGTGFDWSLNYANGGTYFNNATSNWGSGCAGISCRYNNLGGGIPSGVVVTVSPSGMTGLVGVGGGVGTVPLASPSPYQRLFWHQSN